MDDKQKEALETVLDFVKTLQSLSQTRPCADGARIMGSFCRYRLEDEPMKEAYNTLQDILGWCEE